MYIVFNIVLLIALYIPAFFTYEWMWDYYITVLYVAILFLNRLLYLKTNRRKITERITMIIFSVILSITCITFIISPYVSMNTVIALDGISIAYGLLYSLKVYFSKGKCKCLVF